MGDYHSLSEGYRDLLAIDANTCVELGIDLRLDELPDPSLDFLQRQSAAAAKLQEAAEDFANRADDFHQQLDARLIALDCSRLQLHNGLRMGGRLQAEQLPDAGEAISSGIFLLFVNDPRPPADRLANIAARLEQVPSFLQAMLARLDTPVARWVAIEQETIEGLPELFDTLLAWARAEHPAIEARLAAAIATATASLESYSRELVCLPTTTAFALGTDQAAQVVACNGIELTLDDIHQVACEFVQRTRAEIEQLRERLVARYQLTTGTSVQELQQFLVARHAVKVSDGEFGQVIERYRQVAADIDAFIADRNLFPVPAGQAMNIIQTPEFMAPMIPAGAMMPPAALREGICTSMVYLTLSEELLDEHNELGIPVMMVHEGIPGHHLQLATAAMHSSIVRRTFDANEHAEGWTTMLEDYMLDQGLMGELEDEARFITKLDISRIGARVGIDLYFMTGEKRFLDIGYDLQFDDEDPFANAARLLVAATGFTPGRAQAELNWYSQERGYPLSYLVGNHLVWELKRDYEKAVGDRLPAPQRDTEFHRIYLESGCMPVSMLRDVYAHELDRKL